MAPKRLFVQILRGGEAGSRRRPPRSQVNLYKCGSREASLGLQSVARGVNFSGWDLKPYELRGASFEECICSNLNLDGMDLSGFAGVGSHFNGSHFSRATLSNGNFAASRLDEADLSKVWAPDSTWRWASLVGAKLSGGNFSNADFCGADLRGAELLGALMVGAVLREADLRGVDLSGVLLNRVELGEAIFDEKTKWPDDFELPRRLFEKGVWKFDENVVGFLRAGKLAESFASMFRDGFLDRLDGGAALRMATASVLAESLFPHLFKEINSGLEWREPTTGTVFDVAAVARVQIAWDPKLRDLDQSDVLSLMCAATFELGKVASELGVGVEPDSQAEVPRSL